MIGRQESSAESRETPVMSTSTGTCWWRHIASNRSTRCFVLPWRINFNVLYLSRPDATILLYSMSLCVTADFNFVASSSTLSDCVQRAVRTSWSHQFTHGISECMVQENYRKVILSRHLWPIFLHSPPPPAPAPHFCFIPAQNSHSSPMPILPY